MVSLNLSNPLFATYVIAATLVILKAVSMSWLTVVRMLAANGGFRSPASGAIRVTTSLRSWNRKRGFAAGRPAP